MKKSIFKIGLLSIFLSLSACSDDSNISETSVLPSGDNDTPGPVTDYLREYFVPHGIKVISEWDRSQFGKSRDILRNLYPPKEGNVIPAMEMVDHVWIQTYEEVAGKGFIKGLTPNEFILAGGSAYNDDQTRTLGVATSGVRVSLFEVDYVVNSKSFAEQFIHTIQHEYIHILNQKHDFVEKDFGAETMGDYTTNWNRVSPAQALELGFVTPYASNTIFEDFAETASYMLTHTTEQYNAMLESFKIADSSPVAYRPGRAKIINKVQFVRDYFKDKFSIDFDQLAAVANRNAADSPLLSRPASGASEARSTYGTNRNGVVHTCTFHAMKANK